MVDWWGYWWCGDKSSCVGGGWRGKRYKLLCCFASSVSVFFYRLWGVAWRWWYLFPVPKCILFQGILSSKVEIPLPRFYFWSRLCPWLPILLLLQWSLVKVFLRISHIGCSLVWAREGGHGKWDASSSMVVVLVGSWQVQFFPKFWRGLYVLVWASLGFLQFECVENLTKLVFLLWGQEVCFWFSD